MDTSTELLLEANRKSLEAASGHNLSALTMTPLETGHYASMALAGVQFGLSVSLLALSGLAAIGVFSLVAGLAVAMGVALILISVALGLIQAYIARSRIEDFLSLSF